MIFVLYVPLVVSQDGNRKARCCCAERMLSSLTEESVFMHKHDQGICCD